VLDTDRWRVAETLGGQDLLGFVAKVAKGVRMSGSPEESEAFDYIESYLTDLGFKTTRYAAESLIGFPQESRLHILEPRRADIRCNGYSLTPSTSDAGVVGELVFAGYGTRDDYQRRDVTGKIVLTTGLANAEKAMLVDRTGALAQIHINEDHIYEMCISPVWGTPTPATLELLPKTPAVAISRHDGEVFTDLLAKGKVVVRVLTKTYRDWRPIPNLTADLPGAQDDKFVLFSGHVDSWHYGAMDNAAANAAQLVIARLLSQQKHSLYRGIRLAFWSGHSHGRYSGSAWYADHSWQDLFDHCVAHVNVDSLGARGAEDLSETPTMAETYAFAAQLIAEASGQKLKYFRMGRSSDQSFWGIGVPSMFDVLSVHPSDWGADEHRGRLGPWSLGWWWHTPEDTIDKLDPELLERDAKIYAATIWDLCTAPRLPVDYSAGAREMQAAIARFAELVPARIELEALAELAGATAASIARFNSVAPELSPDVVNATIHELGHLLIPVNYTEAGPFDQDLAIPSEPVPGLASSRQFGELRTETNVNAAATKLIRERNRVGAALNAANRLVSQHISS
jgi:hypothetical protein